MREKYPLISFKSSTPMAPFSRAPGSARSLHPICGQQMGMGAALQTGAQAPSPWRAAPPCPTSGRGSKQQWTVGPEKHLSVPRSIGVVAFIIARDAIIADMNPALPHPVREGNRGDGQVILGATVNAAAQRIRDGWQGAGLHLITASRTAVQWRQQILLTRSDVP